MFLHLPTEVRNKIYSHCLTVYQYSNCPRTATANGPDGDVGLFPDNSSLCSFCTSPVFYLRRKDVSSSDDDLGQHRALVHVNRESMGDELHADDAATRGRRARYVVSVKPALPFHRFHVVAQTICSQRSQLQNQRRCPDWREPTFPHENMQTSQT